MISLVLSLLMAMSFCICILAAAEENGIIVSTSYEYIDDETYFVTTIIEYPSKGSISGSKTTSYVSSNTTQWTYTINGTFSYNGSSSSCTSVSDSYSISNSNWHMDSHSCWKSGNTANGTVTMKHKVLGVTINTVTRSLVLSCSPNGTLS